MKNKGFTLIEILITTAIMAIVGGLMTGIFYTVTEVNQRETASGEVTSQLNFVTQTIQRLVRESSNIEIEAGTATTTLKLRMADSAKDPTCITFVSSTIRLAEGPDTNNPENCTSNATDLTNNKVIVDSLNFKKFTQYPGHDTVSFDIAMTYNSQDPAAQVQRTLQSAIARVSAATFDANLLPGDTSYTLGQVGSAWQNIIAADGTAANPSYTFSNNTGLGIFRAGVDTLGFSTAGAERMRIASSSYIGIGTTLPNEKLHIYGDLRLMGDTTNHGIYFTRNYGPGTNPNSGEYYRSSIEAQADAGWGGGLVFSTAPSSENPDLAERMRISKVGYVGIGTTNPQYKLDVQYPDDGYIGYGSGIRINYANGYPGANVIYGNLANYSSMHRSLIKLDSSGTTRFVVRADGSVGIGTSTPSAAKLVVVGTISASGPTEDYHVATRAYVDAAGSGGLTWEGYTSTFTGNLGGYKGANAKCESDYPGSHWASVNEIMRLGASYPYTDNIWVRDAVRTYDPGDDRTGYAGGSSTGDGRSYEGYCNGWTSAEVSYNGSVTRTTDGFTLATPCSNARKLGCVSE